MREPRAAAIAAHTEKVSIKRTPSILKFDKQQNELPISPKEPELSIVSESVPENQHTLTSENLILSWKQIATEQQATRLGLANLMDAYLPMLKDEELEIMVDSQLQYQLFQDQIDFLRNQLQKKLRGNLTITIKIAQNGEIQKTKLYTPQDKFKRLVETNKYIALLQKELGLDFDYNT